MSDRVKTSVAARAKLYGAEGFRRWQEGRSGLLRELVADGWTPGQIAELLGMSRQRVSVLLAQLRQSS